MSSEAAGGSPFTPSGKGYTPPPKLSHRLAIFSFASIIPGSAICFLVLVAYGAIAFFTPARRCLDRVSFRLLCYALFTNVLFGISWGAAPAEPGMKCNINAFFTNLFLLSATFLTTCIALNLQLVLVHGLNGARLEKWYRLGSTILALVINVPPFVLGQFGWDLMAGVCWYGNTDPNLRLRWYLATQSVWIALSLLIELLCSTVVVIWLFRSKRSIDELVKDIQVIPASLSTTVTASESTPSSTLNELASSSLTEATRDPPHCTDPEHELSLVWGRDHLRSVVFRIALYPMVSILMNLSTLLLDLHVGITGVVERRDFDLLFLDIAIYALRPFAYGMLAAFDPSFINAIRAIRRRKQNQGVAADNRGIPLTRRPRTTSHTTTLVDSQQESTADFEANPSDPYTRCSHDEEVKSISRQI